MKKLLFLCFSVLMLCGCPGDTYVDPLQQNAVIDKNIRPEFYYLDDGLVKTRGVFYMCDTKTNNVYVHFTKGGGLSPYYDAEGKIVKCNDIVRYSRKDK